MISTVFQFLRGRGRLPAAIAIEICRTTLVVVAMSIATAILAQAAFPAIGGDQSHWWSGTRQFLQQWDVDRYGHPIWPTFVEAARQTLPLVGLAAVCLGVLSVALAAIFISFPRLDCLRHIVLCASAIPSFVIPLLPYPLCSSEPLRFADMPAWLPLLALIIGDLNLYSMLSVARNSMRREAAQPYVGLIRSLGRHPARDIWPRAFISVLAGLAARTPYLLGSTIVLEMMFNIPGLGSAVRDAVFGIPVDRSLLLWVCVLCLVVSRLLSLGCRLASIWFLGSRGARAGEGLAGVSVPTSVASGTVSAAAVESRADGEAGSDDASPEVVTISALPAVAPVTGVCQRIIARFRVHARTSRSLVPSATMFLCAVGCLLCAGAWTVMAASGDPPPAEDMFASAGPGYPLGTDIDGNSVAHVIAYGFRQQLPALGCSLFVALLLSSIVSLAGVVGALLDGGAGLLLRCLYWVGTLSFEFVEALPKLIVFLAAVSLFKADHIIFKMYVLLGILFAPQMRRAFCDGLSVLHQAAFMEAVKTMRVPLQSVIYSNIIRNHLVHSMTVQSAILLAAIVHMDALIGFAVLVPPSGVVTWGTTLGTATKQYVEWRTNAGCINEFALTAPFAAVWLTTVVLCIAADFLKIVVGDHVYR